MEAKNDYNSEDLSILSWIINNDIKTEKGEVLDFTDRLFLLDILTDWSQEIVIKKCAQIGGSVTFNLKALYATLKFGWNIIYSFPTDSDVNEFVNTKTNMIIKNNPVFGQMSSDNVQRKTLGDRTLFFKGTVSKTAAIMTTADLLIHDEASRSDQMVLDMMKSRIKASQYKGRWMFSNPTTDKDAIDIAWHKSDMKEWHIVCPSCETEQVMTFPDSIHVDDNGKAEFICKSCTGVIDPSTRRNGYWKATTVKENTKVSGYHISLFMAPWVTAQEIYDDSKADQQYFYNFVLGEPYVPTDFEISKRIILDNWTPKDIRTGKYYLGVDVGNIKHYVLGSELGILKIGKFTKWSDLDEMIRIYNPVMVIDSMPDHTMSKYYVENYRNVNMCIFKQNKDNPKLTKWWGEKEKRGIVYANRNRIIDELIDVLLRGKLLFNIENHKDIKTYLAHWEALRRERVEKRNGEEIYEWTSTNGEDHFVFATLYYYLALASYGGAMVFSEGVSGTNTIDLSKATSLEDLTRAFYQNNGMRYEDETVL